MTEHERLGALRGVAELANADDATLRSLVAFFDEVWVPAGVVLAREGQLGHEFLVVACGDVEVCRRGRAQVLRPGGSFGWTAMHERGRHDATVVTMSPARLLVMSHAQFRAAEAVPRLAHLNVRAVNGRCAEGASGRMAVVEGAGPRGDSQRRSGPSR